MADDLIDRLRTKAMGYPSRMDCASSIEEEAADTITTLHVKVSELETQLRGATIMFSDTADTIATLRADLAKAVEGLEAICEAHVLVSLRGRDHVPSMRLQQDCIGAAQSLIKELRP